MMSVLSLQHRQLAPAMAEAVAAPKVYRELSTPLEIPANKKEAFAAVAAYYACEARLGSKIVS